MTIQHLRSSTANKRPTPAAMSDGQLAVNTNTASPGLFFKDSAGALIKVGPVHVGTTAPNASPASGGETGNTVGEQWLDTSGGTYVFKVWDGSAWRSESGTFVDVNGDVMTGALGIIAGSAGSPGLYFSGDTNTGIYSPGADQVAISTNGTGRLFVDASGRVLTGTSTARSNFFNGSVSAIQQVEGANATDQRMVAHIYGSAAGDSAAYIFAKHRSTSIGGNTIVSNGDTLGLITFQGSDGSEFVPAAYIYTEVDGTPGANDMPGRIVLATTADGASSPTERLRIDSSGRLLVGTSSARSGDGVTPRVFLEGAQSIQAFGVCCNESSTPGAGAYVFLSRSRGSAVGGSTIVSNGDTLGGINFYGADGTDTETAAAYIQCFVDGTPGADDMPGRLVFSTTADGASSPTERMRITNAGLHYFMANGNDTTRIQNTAAAGTATSFLAAYHSSTAGTVNTGTLSLNITTNGNITNTNNSYGAISDIKLKENIVDANSQWDDIRALQVRKYNFKEGQTHTQIGLVAQEVELVSPGLVTESPDRDAEGNDLGTVTKSVNYSVLYMKAVKALQEAMERIELLEARLDAANL